MTGLFCDTFDLYHRIKRKYSAKLNYGTLVKKVAPRYLYCYGMATENDGGFVTHLRSLGFRTRFKKPRIVKEVKLCDWGVSMAMDVVELREDLDTVVFATCNLNILPIIWWLNTRGINVIVCGVDVPDALSKFAVKTVEITEEYLI